MGRTARVDVDNGRYHVMNSGVNRQVVFFSDADRVEFGRLLGVIWERFEVRTLAYCLMDNHYHLVLHCPAGGLSDAMQLLGAVFTRHANDRIGRDGPLFRGRFHSIPVMSDAQLMASVRYVHRNALDVGGVTDVSSYRWSSHRTYLGHRQVPPFLDSAQVLEIFGGTSLEFDKFVRVDLRGALVLPASEALRPILAMAVDQSFGLDTPGPNVVRTMIILLLDIVCDRDRERLERLLDFPNPEAQDRAERRARQRRCDDPRLGSALGRAIGLFGGHTVPDTV
jgi:REP element-mobilizing transposase RayT